jgi:hypothetical protein
MALQTAKGIQERIARARKQHAKEVKRARRRRAWKVYVLPSIIVLGRILERRPKK